MKIKYRLPMITIIIVLSISLAACGGATKNSSDVTSKISDNEDSKTSEQEPKELSFGIWTPETHMFVEKAAKPWIEYVSEKTNGSIEVSYQSGAVLGSSGQVMEDVGGGVYDIGHAINLTWVDTPLFKTSIVDLPFAFSNADDHLQAYNVAKRYVNEYALDSYEELGVKFMSMGVIDPNIILSKEPIRNMDDLKGKKVRVASKSWVPI